MRIIAVFGEGARLVRRYERVYFSFLTLKMPAHRFAPLLISPRDWNDGMLGGLTEDSLHNLK